MRSAQPLRPRTLAETLFLVAVVACLIISLARIALVGATVPYAIYLNRRAAAEGTATRSLGSRLAGSGPWRNWWGGRPNPHRDGGDYLGVMSRHITSRNLGCVTGVLIERNNAKGYGIAQVIVPADTDALIGEATGNLMKRADGTEFRTYWAPISRDVALFSDVPIITQKYDPVLRPLQAENLRKTAGLKEQSREYYVAKPKPGGAGTWVLYADATAEKRHYVLIPLEASPLGGAK